MEIKKVFTLSDYYSGTQIGDKEYATREEAEMAKNAYLTYKASQKEIHNNVIIVVETLPQNIIIN